MGCTESKKKACASRNGPFLDAICGICEEKDLEPSPYVVGLYQNVMLIEAGFPFDADTFSLDYWMDLSIMRQAIRQKSGRCPLF